MKFFVSSENIETNKITFAGDDHNHITRTLRMRPGERITVYDGAGYNYLCSLSYFDNMRVEAEIIEKYENKSEPSVFLTVFAGYPKGDKTDIIVQKCVELGAARVVFFMSERCIARLDEKNSKILRLERIALEAAKQSERGIIPSVGGVISFEEMLKDASTHDVPLFFYERGGKPIRELLEGKEIKSVAVITGPEGGFSEREVSMVIEAKISVASLGKRILRCETAPLCAVSAIMFATDNL